MGVIFASLRLCGKEQCSMDFFMQLVHVSNINFPFLVMWTGICPPKIYYFSDIENLFSNVCGNWLNRETANT